MKSELKLGQMRIPDILETIADLSNDEVFTPPDLANKVLDMLPKEIWSNSTITFLDPACKTGVFLREITKRLIEGLEDEIPDLQERVNHILTKQVYGLAITELTALMSRRTVYCATKANSETSVVTAFDNEEGNIKFPKSKHSFHEKTKKCTICGAGEELYGEVEGMDNYAYSFIQDNLKEVFGDVKFDVIIGNPPYQLEDGANNGSAIALYDKFVDKSIEMSPKYISMIVPSRWFIGGKGLDEFRSRMVRDTRIKKLHNFEDAREAFKQVGIFGGVNYFLWDSQYDGKCEITTTLNGVEEYSKRYLNSDKNKDIFISNNTLFGIVEKVKSKKEKTFDSLVSPRNPYSIKDNASFQSSKTNKNNIQIYEQKGKKDRFVDKKDVGRFDFHFEHKIFITFAYGTLEMENAQVINKPIKPEKDSICSGTYLTIGPFNNENEVDNAIDYMKTKFFRILISALKNTQHGTKKTYSFVPMQDFSKKWNDSDLYNKYGLNQKEIKFIEERIRALD